MFTKNPFNKKDEVADLIGNILEADYKVKKEELKGNQHKIDMNKNNKIDAHDFKLLRSKGASQKDEEIDPNKVTTDTLRGRTAGKSANPFLSQKTFMDVPDNVKEEVDQIDEATSVVGKPKISGPTKGATPYGDSFKSITTHHVIDGKKYTVTTDHDHDGGHFHEIHSGKKRLHLSYTNEYGRKDPSPHHDPSLDSATKRKLSADHNRIAKLHHPDRDDLDEEVEQIDELSSSTIDSYRKKLGAKIDTTRTARPSVQAAIKAKNAPIQAKIHNALMKQHQAIRRERGMSEPAKKLPEEVEQLDEIGDTPAGKRALRAVQNRAADTMSDPSKSSKQVNKAVGAGVSAGNRLHGFGHDRMKKNTVMGRDALRKQLGVKEEVEQIDELNKDTLYSYNKKAGADVEKKDKSLGQLIRKGDSAGANKAARQLNNRLAGQERAEKRLNKEEVEQIDERELTKGETKEKERIVKGMKKSLSGFKQRYGDRAKSVMYATATKAAKKG